MKSKLLPAFLFAVALAVTAFAAAYTKQNTRVPRFQIQTEFQGNTGTALSVRADAYLETLLINDADATEVHGRGKWVQVSFDFLDPLLTGQTITAAGETVTYPALAALIRQASLDRATAQGVNP
jgi:hypothetical protein